MRVRKTYRRKSLRYKRTQKRQRQMLIRRRGGVIHPGATVVFKSNNYGPFQMGTPEEAEKLFETRNVYKL